MWPLNFWLPPAYAAASAPAAAMFAILTKVGVYAVLRLWTLVLPGRGRRLGRRSATDVLLWGGLATLAFGALGMLASQQLARLAGYSVIVSSGTLLAAIGFGAAGADRRRAVLPGELDAGRPARCSCWSSWSSARARSRSTRRPHGRRRRHVLPAFVDRRAAGRRPTSTTTRRR